MKIETGTIKTELQELNGDLPIKVKCNKEIWGATRTDIRDNGIVVTLNPAKIHSQKALDEHLNDIRGVLSR